MRTEREDQTNHIIVCDDEALYRQQIIYCIEQYDHEYQQKHNIYSYESGIELLQKAANQWGKCLLLFLDVEMSGMSGMETAMEIRKTHPEVNICFVTSHQSYAFQSYEVEAIGYLAKPATYESVKHILEKAIERNKQRLEREEAQKYFINVGKMRTLIKCDNIIYIEKIKNKIVIHCFDDTVEEYDALKKLYQQLNHIQFRYIHESIIVNCYCIQEVCSTKIILKDGIELPLSRAYVKEMKQWENDKMERLRQERFQERRRRLKRE
jgi:DNA-binding LytR/AlgR family response regulator